MNKISDSKFIKLAPGLAALLAEPFVTEVFFLKTLTMEPLNFAEFAFALDHEPEGWPPAVAVDGL